MQELDHNGLVPIGIYCVKSPNEYATNPSCSLNPSIEAFSTENMAALATKIQGEHPDAIFFGGRNDRGASLLRKQLGELRLDRVPFVGADALVNEKDAFFGTIGPHAANLYATFPAADPSTFISPSAQTTAATFFSQYQKEFNEPPGPYSANGYDAANIVIRVLKNLIDTGQPVTREGVVQAVLGHDFEGVAGNQIHFDQNGDNTGQRVYTVYQSRQQQSQGIWDWTVLTQLTV